MPEDQDIPEEQSAKSNQTSEKVNEPVVQQQISEPSTSNLESQTPNMEVHHHPNLHHRKKHWKEYLFEFLMIFLAVTLGFFAENLREHISDSRKEKEFIKSLTEDLKKDTAEFTIVYAWQNRILTSMDSCLKIQPEQLNNIDEQDRFYPYFVYVYSWVETFSANDNTYTQLRNAGEFSVVHNQAVLDSIGLFYKYYERFVVSNSDYYNNFFYKLVDVASQMMKLPMPPNDANDSAFSQIPDHIKIFTHTDDISVQQLYSWIRNLKGTLLTLMDKEENYFIRAQSLISFLNTKYNIQ